MEITPYRPVSTIDSSPVRSGPAARRSAHLRVPESVERELPRGPLERLTDWVERKSLPEPDTGGNFEGQAYAPVLMGAAIEGLTLQGPIGAATNTAAALAAKLVEGRTHSSILSMASGAAVGAALAAAFFPAGSGATLALNAAIGGVMGAYQVFGGNRQADIRGAGNFATMVSGLAVPGPAKIAGGIASAATELVAGDKKPMLKAAIGGLAGAALGTAMAMVGLAPVGVVTAAVAMGLAGAVGPNVGPRFTQFFRNVSKDFGTLAERGLRKLGVIRHELDPKVRNSMGALPASLIKEGTTGLIYADGSLWGLVAGAGCTAIQQVAVFMCSKVEPPTENGKGS